MKTRLSWSACTAGGAALSLFGFAAAIRSADAGEMQLPKTIVRPSGQTAAAAPTDPFPPSFVYRVSEPVSKVGGLQIGGCELMDSFENEVNLSGKYSSAGVHFRKVPKDTRYLAEFTIHNHMAAHFEIHVYGKNRKAGQPIEPPAKFVVYTGVNKLTFTGRALNLKETLVNLERMDGGSWDLISISIKKLD